jgi:hypothetical protein
MPLLVSLLASCGFHALRALREVLHSRPKAVEAAELVLVPPLGQRRSSDAQSGVYATSKGCK